ncbi:phosphogluconate dehydrogenase (NAD(+)-dependent, decarboxylating) [Tepidibacillus fermentans]|uniref:6-phosphogluconate dehydrogenase n=1 Tax=Tepidibacillus fermentans TaxID=1281767 RepID=A0A4R3K8Y4_9BACI|nr:decarboxylating 6-phosphogluconate dehydrogenase [Tepidibacillus fermentans]TCS79400.1 6-phosphogluconate dehydrogenase [Tepidibacillus fermentans]
MKLGMVGLGKMGFNLVLNLLDYGHDVVVFDVNEERMELIGKEGAMIAKDYQDMVQKLDSPRIIWLMIPAGALVDQVIEQFVPHLSQGDILIDGGNSNYKDTLRRAKQLKEKGIHFVDVGTSGGMEGARKGACLMIGGDQEVFHRIEPIFKDISVENGYLYTGEVGSGHFLKMVHNGIEYGMMQAIAEGFEILEKSPFEYDYQEVSRVWNHGSVIRGWLMELMEHAFSKEPKLESIKGVMHSSGEGKWTVETALDLQTAAPVIALSLMMRYRSLEEDTFAGKVVAALRNEFGGHAVEKKE